MTLPVTNAILPLGRARVLDPNRPCRDPQCRCLNHQMADPRDLGSVGLDPATLTATESRIVAALLPPGLLQPSHEILRRVWGPEYVLDDSRHLLRVNIARIRHKLPPGYAVECVVGRGYRLWVPPQRIRP